jgi:hypothetical protein
MSLKKHKKTVKLVQDFGLQCVDTQLSIYVYISYLTVCVLRECDEIW